MCLEVLGCITLRFEALTPAANIILIYRGAFAADILYLANIPACHYFAYIDNNASLTKDLQSTVPREALPLLTATRLKHYSHPQNPSDITDCDLSNNNAIKEGTVSPSITLSPKSTAERTLYRLEEYNTKLDIQLRKGNILTPVTALNQSD